MSTSQQNNPRIRLSLATWLALIAMIAAATLWYAYPASAATVTGVSVSRGSPTVSWTLNNEAVAGLEISASASVDANGFFTAPVAQRTSTAGCCNPLFPGSNLTFPGILDVAWNATSWSGASFAPAPVTLNTGTYYVHVLTFPGCASDFCFEKTARWSNIYSFTVGPSDAAPPPPPAPTRRRAEAFVSYRLLGGSVRYLQITVRYYIYAPLLCPESEPSDVTGSAWSQWISDGCADYVLQKASVDLTVHRRKRIVYRDHGTGVGDGSQYPSLSGGAWQTVLYPFQLRGGCVSGRYNIRIRVADPYGGPAAKDATSFSCRRLTTR